LREPLWQPDLLPPAAFIHGSGLDFPTLWIGSRPNETQVTAWCGGPRARALAALESHERHAAARRSVAAIFGRSEASVERVLIGAHDHSFSNDAFSRGAYPYLLAGGDSRAPLEPESATLFFASDFTDPSELGTVGSAIESAAEAANALYGSLH